MKILLDPVGNAMNIWWGNPREAYSSEETDSPYNNDVIVKNKRGVPIGVEIIGVFPEELNVARMLKSGKKLNFKEPFLLEASKT